MNNEYKVLTRTASIDEYKTICDAVGWSGFMNFEAAEEALKHSLFGVVVQYEDESIGMGRIVGDGSIYFYIQDIAVVSQHQGNGVGTLIMKALLSFLQEHAPEKAFVGLFASQGKEQFYNKYGFNKHDGMTGMFGVMHGGEIK